MGYEDSNHFLGQNFQVLQQKACQISSTDSFFSFSMLNIDGDSGFDAEGIYHTKLMKDHETLMEYLNSLPNETNNTLIGSNLGNHWNKNEEDGNIFSIISQY